MSKNQKGFIPILGILILLAGLVAGVYLIKHPTIFRPKAENNQTRIEFVDSSGNQITQTQTNQVKVKLTYILPDIPPLVSDNFQPLSPFYATFFYPWYQNAAINGSWNHWNDLGHNPPSDWFSKFRPMLGLYSSKDDNVIYWQLQKLAEAKQTVAISSWWGQGSYEDQVFDHIINNIMKRGDNPYPHLRWAIYYEIEANEDPSVDKIISDLNYLAKYTSQPAYLKVDGKPVIFVYANSDHDKVDFVNRWSEARNRSNTYIVLKVFDGWEAHSSKVDAWHQYAPAERRITNNGASHFGVSPGFWFDGDSSPRLSRNIDDFRNAVSDMVKSNAIWKTVQTWNEWGEGTSVEPADSFGNSYIDVLSQNLPNISTGATGIPVSTFPTAFRIANSAAFLNSAQEQLFTGNNQIVDWNLPNEIGSKTIFVQFKVDGNWQNPISTTINLNLPTQPGVINGFKVVMPNNQSIEPAASQNVLLDGQEVTINNPYFLTNIPAGNHTVSVTEIPGFNTGFTLCINDINCHGNTPTLGNSVSVNVPSGGTADLWWHYTPISRLSPSPSPTPTSTPPPIPQVTCSCDHPGGSTPNNGFSCTDGTQRSCASNEKCTTSSVRPAWPCELISIPSTPVPTPVSTPTSTPLVGDINNDRVVNQSDFTILVQNFGKTGTNIQGDLNHDGKVDIFDYVLLIQNYGKTN